MTDERDKDAFSKIKDQLEDLKLQKKNTPTMSEEEIFKARKAERDGITNTRHNPKKDVPRIPHYSDIERICKAAVVQYRDNINRILEEQREAGKPAMKTKPDGSREELISIQMHLKLERFEVKGKELIERYGFDAKVVRPGQIINAYQLAMFKEIRAKVISNKNLENDYSKQFYASPADQTVKEMYEDKGNILVYHAFYPLAGQGDTKAKALLELYQGLVSTMFSWGMNHQEAISKEMTAQKIEEDRVVIEEKVREFNELAGFDPDADEDERQ